ncbi:MAG: hypothetical protein EBS54_02170 [Betaproteobacteria bacterium]|nr:hypothetical protein [Betaproteobacteria bacterium]NBT05597.1 hypothetical protein [Betaproteobacteria bacterium]
MAAPIKLALTFPNRRKQFFYFLPDYFITITDRITTIQLQQLELTYLPFHNEFLNSFLSELNKKSMFLNKCRNLLQIFVVGL